MKKAEDINEFVTDNYNELMEITKKIAGNRSDSEDLCHETIIELLILPPDKQIHLLRTNSIKYYFIRIIKLSIISPSSRYQRKYGFNSVEYLGDYIEYQNIPDSKYETFYDDIQDIIATKLRWDLKMIMDMRIQDLLTFKEIQLRTKIPIASVFNLYKKAKEEIKTIYYNEYYDK